MIDLALLAVLVASVGAVLVLTLRKLPYLASLDVKELPEAEGEHMREVLVYRSLKRKVLDAARMARAGARPIAARVNSWTRTLAQKIEATERDYRARARRIERIAPKSNLATFLHEADDLSRRGDFEAAEKKFIEIVGLEPHRTATYRALGELYLRFGQFVHAEQSFRHALRLSPEDAEARADLAQLFRTQGKLTVAREEAEFAVAREPANPKFLNLLLDIALELHDRSLAEQTLAQLVESNPENQKLDELRAAVQNMG